MLSIFKQLIVGIPKWWKQLNSSLKEHSSLLSAWASLLAIMGIPLILLGGFNAWIQVKDFINRPDIELYLGNPKSVNFRLINFSSVLLEDPQYGFSLWDLDARKEGSGDDPGNLMIPVKSLNYIRPKSGLGPFSIKGLSSNAGKIPDGHIVFGWAYVQCPDCVSRKDYWVLIKEGEMGWYSKIQPEEQISIWKHLSSVIDSGANYPKVISELVPKKNRIAIVDSPVIK